MIYKAAVIAYNRTFFPGGIHYLLAGTQIPVNAGKPTIEVLEHGMIESLCNDDTPETKVVCTKDYKTKRKV
jgi:hypothetical protein